MSIVEELSRLQGIGPKHPMVKHAQAIANNKTPNPEKLVFVEGVWVLNKILEANIPIHTLFVCPELVHNVDTFRSIQSAATRAVQAFSVSTSTLEKLAEKGDSSGVGLLVSLRSIDLDELMPRLKERSIVVVADAVEIPGNIGTILRTTDAVGGDALILCNKKARITHPKVVRGSQGACFFVPIIEAEVSETEAWFAKHGFDVVFADTKAPLAFDEYKPKKRVAIIMGSERYGISDQWTSTSASSVSIPMYGVSDSLNVAVATSILLYQVKQAQERGRMG